ncbi:hypothetical protein CIB95_12150 [Lottiidibacillus patelloidae]|uniref:Phosphoribosyltransferase domain-containing protein n=1 Tax=Lottiidibacillus patelloidae TaxID=2670334 RepID=A0A263BT22_9BACI|nr:phosphoribosyltransferase family protein [Lottiidibacillus patelloidae]OZM56517.1 hypothetical protein CIB95_12150 [Lottiidibacillus patelloidae]
MSNCRWCGNAIDVLGWDILLCEETRTICAYCESLLEKTSEFSCVICHKRLQRNMQVCVDCKRWENNSDWHGVLTKNRSLYYYNEFLKDVIAKYKYRGDYELVKLFKLRLQKVYNEDFSGLPTVPIPLSKKRQYARGFNQAVGIAEQLKVPIHNVLTRLASDKKQSKKDKKKRFSYKKPMFACKDLPHSILKGGEVLIIDDVYTTGATIRHAAKALKDRGVARVFSLTLAR